MTDFLLKSTLCLGLLFAVYFFLLEKEKMHRFNRFFLLLSLLFSLVIPFISLEMYTENIEVIQQHTIQAMPISFVVAEERTDLSVILWSIYGLVTTALVFRFVANLIKIKQKINSNRKEVFQNSTLILLDEKILPHTFLNCIFINKEDYKNRKIEDELYTHELTHVREKHTLDILFIEMLKTVFWFNPMFLLYKRAIQLNHEFLADEKVVKYYNNVPFYQNLLVEKASWNSNFYLYSNLNFLVTKKRLIMMTKTTSYTTYIVKISIILPLLFVAALLSCKKEKIRIHENIDAPITVIETENAITNEGEVYTSVETKPAFAGGISAFYKYIAENYQVPEVDGLNGRVFAQFVIEKDGSVTDIKIIRDIGYGTGKEAIRVLKNSPKWIPAKQNGRPVRVLYSLPISIKNS